MRYDLKTKGAAYQLYLKGLAVKKIAEELNVSHENVVYDWIRDGNWLQKKNEIAVRSTEIIEQKAIEKIVKDKQEYRDENLKLLDFQKAIYIEVNKQLQLVLKNNPELAFKKNIRDTLEKATDGIVTVVKAQDDMLFSRSKVDINIEANIQADMVYKTILEQIYNPGINTHDDSKTFEIGAASEVSDTKSITESISEIHNIEIKDTVNKDLNQDSQ